MASRRAAQVKFLDALDGVCNDEFQMLGCMWCMNHPLFHYGSPSFLWTMGTGKPKSVNQNRGKNLLLTPLWDTVLL